MQDSFPNTRSGPIFNAVCAVLLLLHAVANVGCSQPVQQRTDTENAAKAQPSFLKTEADLAPWKFIVLHHSATASGSVESIHAVHQQRRDSAGNPWLGIGYHFVIGNGDGMEDGQIASTFRWQEQLPGAHAGQKMYNETGIGICLIGNFENQKPTEKQVKSAAKLVSLLRNQFGMTPNQILRHGDIKATACPGRKFPLKQIVSSTPQGSEVTHHHTQATQPARFAPVTPDHTEEVRNVAAFSRSKFRSRIQPANLKE